MNILKTQKSILLSYSILLVIVFQLSMVSCNKKESEMNIKKIKIFQKKIEYPYVASTQRSELIFENMNKLRKEMTTEDVMGLLGNPDEVNLTHKNIKNNSVRDNVTGFSLVYLLRRDVENGSVNEKNERLLIIHFNKSEKLIWSQSINIDDFNAIENK